MTAPVHFLPYHLAHRGQGQPRQGRGRQAKGLLLRGVVTAVHLPGDPATRGVPTGGQTSGVTVDVVIAEPTYRTVLYNLPIVVQSGGIDDHEQWVPSPATGTVSGADLVLSPEGGQVACTPLHDMNGDWVLIGFLADDLNQPVVIGQLPHPSNTVKPQHPTTDYRWRRILSGVDFGVDADGNYTVLLAGTDIATGKKMTVGHEGGSPEPVLRGVTYLTDTATLLTDLSATFTELVALVSVFGLQMPYTSGTTIPNLATFLAEVNTSLGVGAPYLSAHLEVD